MRYQPEKPFIHGESLESLQASIAQMGEKAFRARQIADWLYKKRVRSWEEMANLPANLREKLAEKWTLRPTERVFLKHSSDVTEKLLLRLGDGNHIETVLIRYPQRGVGQEQSRHTVCVSSQVGCAYGCKFCASGLDGWTRDLHAGEIVDQLLEICRLEEERGKTAEGNAATFDNIVMMGMGEPLANYDNVVAALKVVNADWGLGFGARRITVSTSGLAPKIRKLAEEPLQLRLAISLHGATNEVRERIMPVNRKYPLEELIPAAKEFAEKKGRMLTLEFILIEDVNDSQEQAVALAKIARELHAHVNLIPYNTVEGLPWKRPSMKRQRAFHETLKEARISCTIRKEKGHDIDAACGQLRLRKEREALAGQLA